MNGWSIVEPILIDSNVLIYTYDVRDELRQERAFAVVEALGSTGSGRLSVQCLSEFFSRTTRRPFPLLTVLEAAQQITLLSTSFIVYPVTLQIVMEAIRGVEAHHFSFWDAQIWASARLNQVPIVFSEDFNSGAIVEGIRFVNPLTADFRVSQWVT